MIIARSTLQLILDVAHARGTAPAVELRLRTEVGDRIEAEDPGRLSVCGLPVVIDDTIPGFPGFQIARERPGGRR